ncbi:hypothetical protein EGY05_11050 [Chryseobacterium arthrosphaerae]|nr:hypothetical protein EGY05_11050 [Chryseobacterium arthrosphaerae]
MEKINLKLLAIISFSIFIINILKYYLINIEKLLSPYGADNRLISFIMLPIIGIGIILSIIVLIKGVKSFKTNALNMILSLPLIIFFVYFFFLKK